MTKAGGTSARNQLRIIGGQWRGRRFAFRPDDGLRPTADRVRETLFNWLAPEINGARCLDLFAGSGALGLEALSRGAGHCDFVDTNRAANALLGSHLDSLQARDRGRCHPQDALGFLAANGGPWDIVFVDPPFGRELVGPACTALAQPGRLAAGALVYVETPRREPLPALPPHWTLHRDKQAGDVAFRLFAVGETR